MAEANKNSTWLSEVMRPLQPMYREVVVTSLFVNTLALAVPVFTLQVYDRVIFAAGLSTLQGLAVGMMVVLLFDFLLRQTRSRIMQRAALRIDVVIGQKLYQKVMSLPLNELEVRQGAFWQALFRDVDAVRNTLSGPAALLMVDLPFAVLFLGLVVIIAQPIAWVLAIILPTFVFLAWRSGASLASSSKSEKESGFGRDAMLAEIIAGRGTIKALALDDDLRPLWEKHQADTIKKSVQRGGRTDTFVNYGAGLATFSAVAMTSVGALAIIDLNLTMGALIAANMLTSRILGPFNQLVGSWRNYSSFRAAVDRLGSIFALPEERTEMSVQLDRPRGEITLEHVEYRYGPNAPTVLDSVRLHVEPGKLIAVVGANGSGKSTLLKIIQGLYKPTAGRVLLDGADINQFTRREMASWMGYVPQELFLFSGNIRDNIVKGHPGVTDEQIVTAAKLSGLHEFVIDYPDGYSTDIGESGRLAVGTASAQAFKPGESFRDCEECPEMMVLAGGVFAMGSERITPKEQPVHLVSLPGPFAIGRYEVTWDEWEACAAAGGCTAQPDDHLWGRGRRPIINITWDDAHQYTAWLSEHTGATYRLPTEAEWEYAARGGTYTEYPWGDDIGVNMANCRECGADLWAHQSLEVGLFPPNPFGLYDMQGNSWEWIEDCWNDSYAGAPDDGSPWLAGDCAWRIVRSGSWYYFPPLARSAARDRFQANLGSYNIGVRVVRELF